MSDYTSVIEGLLVAAPVLVLTLIMLAMLRSNDRASARRASPTPRTGRAVSDHRLARHAEFGERR